MVLCFVNLMLSFLLFHETPLERMEILNFWLTISFSPSVASLIRKGGKDAAIHFFLLFFLSCPLIPVSVELKSIFLFYFLLLNIMLCMNNLYENML